jgi:hypothetical protein
VAPPPLAGGNAAAANGQGRPASVAGLQRPAGASPEPQSVSFNFKSGIKTTLFSNGAVVTEPFDIPSLKGLAAAPPLEGGVTAR